MITNIHTIARKGGECGDWLLMLVRCRFFLQMKKNVHEIGILRFPKSLNSNSKKQWYSTSTFKVHYLKLVPKYGKLKYTILRYFRISVHFRTLNLLILYSFLQCPIIKEFEACEYYRGCQVQSPTLNFTGLFLEGYPLAAPLPG